MKQDAIPQRITLMALLILAAAGVTACNGSYDTAATTPETNWPQWRGPGGRGVSSATGLPLDWSEHTLWKVPIEGRGYSSPIVWGDRIFLTTAIRGDVIEGAEPIVHTLAGNPYIHPATTDADRHHIFKVLALDATTGELLWEHSAHAGQIFDGRHRRAAFASPSVATDGELVYAWFGPEGLYAYELDGEPAWELDLGDIATFGLGIGTSPVLYEDLLILQVDEDEGDYSFIIAVDKKTGQEVWRVERRVEASWSTPVLIEANGRTELITSATQLIYSYDPATGEELWRTDGLVGTYVVHTPVSGQGLVFFSAGYPAKITRAIAIERPIEQTVPAVVWEYTKGTGYVPSNLVYGDYLYLTSDAGILTCLEPATGKVVYEGGRPPIPGKFQASLFGVDGKIVQISEDGDAFIVKAGPIHEVLATNSLGEPVWASPAIANGRLYIRGHQHLYAIGLLEG